MIINLVLYIAIFRFIVFLFVFYFTFQLNYAAMSIKSMYICVS